MQPVTLGQLGVNPEAFLFDECTRMRPGKAISLGKYRLRRNNPGFADNLAKTAQLQLGDSQLHGQMCDCAGECLDYLGLVAMGVLGNIAQVESLSRRVLCCNPAIKGNHLPVSHDHI